MLNRLYRGLRVRSRRVRLFERRRVRAFGRWVEETDNLIHLSVLLFVPLLIGVVTWLSGALPSVSFLLFPPLAAGTHTLFSDPQGKYSSPVKFVGGLTVGALCGWIALEFSAAFVREVPPGQFHVEPFGAALGVLLTAIVTWALGFEVPSAFSSALLVLVTTTTQVSYVVSVAVSSSLIAVVFVGWRRLFYDQRAEYLYRSIEGDNQVLVPLRGEDDERTAVFGARLAAAHDTGSVVLLKLIDPADLDAIETGGPIDRTGVAADGGEQSATAAEPPGSNGETTATGTTNSAATTAPSGVGENTETADRIREEITAIEERIADHVDVPCEVVVAAPSRSAADTVFHTAEETNCDLVVTAYESDDDGLSPFVRTLFRGDIDTVIFRSQGEHCVWKRVLVPLRGAGDLAHSMLDFAGRLAGEDGWVSACACIDSDSERRAAERRLADLVDTVTGACEIHVANADIEEYLRSRSSVYDLVIMGASTDRSTASRLVSPPTASNIESLDCDLAIVHNA